VGAARVLVLPLTGAVRLDEIQVGGKAAKLGALIRAGYRVPGGFCVTTQAYERFVTAGRLTRLIDLETGRKPLATMRWEELWDAALRLRTAFLRTPVPDDVAAAILRAAAAFPGGALAVRSSAVGEDARERSFAGLHESLIGVAGEEALLDAVRVVWASLWSDAALLYRRELDLDPTRSVMAVVVQEMVMRDRSGVAFGRDPRDPARDQEVIEAVPGLCRDLVDGAVDPDRWLLARSTGEMLDWRPGSRPDASDGIPLLAERDLCALHRTLRELEAHFGWAPDIEWTGRAEDFTLLQVRPVTTAAATGDDDQRAWYLSLRPGKSKLAELCRRVTEELIPELEALGRTYAAEAIEGLSDEQLADVVAARAAAFARWKKTYRDEFIPFAHGVRQLAVYYNDAVKPADAYEFLGLLRHQALIASRRDAALRRLARRLAQSAVLHKAMRAALSNVDPGTRDDSPGWRGHLAGIPGASEFLAEFEGVLAEYLEVAYGGERLAARPDLVLHAILELADRAGAGAGMEGETASEVDAPQLERRLLAAVGPARLEEARAVIDIGRLSWRLRDDDNVLLGRIEHELLRAATFAVERLQRAGRLDRAARVTVEHATLLAQALRSPGAGRVELPAAALPQTKGPTETSGTSPRQLVGQPAAPGLATATARKVLGPEDLKRFRAGEVLICDAIQPTMSHVVPLAAAIVERRGGMLIHGAIIARELGIPCVNGVSAAILSVEDGEIVTVDGYLGIVTIGPPEFELELGPAGASHSDAARAEAFRSDAAPAPRTAP